MTCEVQTYFSEFHVRLNKFRIDEEFCDLAVQIEDRTFPCHRIVLASASEYFAKMLTGEFKERITGNVKLDSISVQIFEEILSYMYSGIININDRNCGELLVVSEYLGLDAVCKSCETYIKRILPMRMAYIKNTIPTMDNVFEILQYAENTGKKELSDILVDHISANLSELIAIAQNSFTNISLETLKLIVRNDLENGDPILNAIIQWVKHDSEKRSSYLSQLLQILGCYNIAGNYEKILARCVTTTSKFDDNCETDIIHTTNKKTLKNVSPLNAYVRYKTSGGLWHMGVFAVNKKFQWSAVCERDSVPLRWPGYYLSSSSAAVGSRL